MRFAASTVLALVSLILGCGHEEPVQPQAPASTVSNTPGPVSNLLFEDRDSISLRPSLGNVVVWELGRVGCECSAEMYEALLRLHKKFSTGVKFLRVDYGQSVKETRSFYDKHPPSFDVLGDPSSAVGQSLPMQALPTLFLFGKWGQLRYIGSLDETSGSRMIEALRAESEPDQKNFYLKKKLGKGDVLPSFRLPDLSGAEKTLEELKRGAKVFVLVFGDTECPLSRRGVASLGKLMNDLKERGAAAALVNVGEKVDAIRKVYEAMNLSFPVLVDPEGALKARYDIEVVPTVFVLNPDGSIAFRSLLNLEAIEQEVKIGLGLQSEKDRKDIPQQGTG